MHLSLGRVYVDVNSLRLDLKTQVEERVPSLGQKGRIRLLNALLDHCRLYGSVVDEEQHVRSLGAVVGITDPAAALKPPSIVVNFQLYQVIGSACAVDLPYTILDCSSSRDRNTAASIIAYFLTREGDTNAVDGVSSHEIQYLCVLLTRGAESPTARWDIVEQIFHRDLSARPPSSGLRLHTLSRFRTCKFSIRIVRFPRTTRFFSPSCDFQVGNVADTRQRLATETIGADGGKIFKRLQLGCCEALAKNW